jgi:hypothetical protein
MERLVASGIASGIPPVSSTVPVPRSAMRGATWEIAVMAPTTFTAYASRCAVALRAPNGSDWISAAL